MSVNQYTTKEWVLNTIWFKISWFICVYFGTIGALIVTPITVGLHLLVVRLRLSQWKFLGAVVVFGFVFDGLLILANVVTFNASTSIPPFWMSALWLSFGTVLTVTLHKTFHKKYLFIVGMGLAGAFGYVLGSTFSDASFTYSMYLTIPILFIAWSGAGYAINLLHRTFVSNTET